MLITFVSTLPTSVDSESPATAVAMRRRRKHVISCWQTYWSDVFVVLDRISQCKHDQVVTPEVFLILRVDLNLQDAAPHLVRVGIVFLG